MPLDATGILELSDDLAGMAAKLDYGSGVARALEAGAEPIEQQMIANASRDPKVISNRLRSSIRKGSARITKGGKCSIVIGVRYKDKGAFYANAVEFGHGGPAPAKPHPFVRPAFDARADEAYSIMKQILRELIK